MLYHHYYEVYGCLTWQSGDLVCEASTHNVKQAFHHVVLQSYVINKKHISTSTMSVATKPGRMVTYNEDLPFIKSYVMMI